MLGVILAFPSLGFSLRFHLELSGGLNVMCKALMSRPQVINPSDRTCHEDPRLHKKN